MSLRSVANALADAKQIEPQRAQFDIQQKPPNGFTI
jgi:hypothetical protein